MTTKSQFDLSPWCSKRLESFQELATDKEYGYKKAAKGLKNWVFQNKHRLTAYDLECIESALKSY